DRYRPAANARRAVRTHRVSHGAGAGTAGARGDGYETGPGTDACCPGTTCNRRNTDGITCRSRSGKALVVCAERERAAAGLVYGEGLSGGGDRSRSSNSSVRSDRIIQRAISGTAPAGGDGDPAIVAQRAPVAAGSRGNAYASGACARSD